MLEELLDAHEGLVLRLAQRAAVGRHRRVGAGPSRGGWQRQRLEDDDVSRLQLGVLEGPSLPNGLEADRGLELDLFEDGKLLLRREAPGSAEDGQQLVKTVRAMRHVGAHKAELLRRGVVELEEEQELPRAKHRPALLVGRGCIIRWLLVGTRPLRIHHLEVEAQLGLEFAGVGRVVLLDVHHGDVVVIVVLQRLVRSEGVVLAAGPHPESLHRGAHARQPPDLLLQVLQRVLLLDAD
mmetsp:Transcript_13521/g.30687  ORF Transcript_13521/g.30687 Transcript_13521/m.30687 type:complete len:238 (-) Transcript_13521:1845-2558(-)